MRILFSSMPAAGHLLPLLPLARAAQDRGDAVAVLSAEGVRPQLAGERVELLPAGPMPDVLFAETSRRTGADPAHEPTPAAVAELFAGTRVDLTAEAALAAATAWRPDLIVCEMCDFVGPLVASALGVPWALASLGTAVPQIFTSAMSAVVAPRYASRGLEPAPFTWFLDLCPPSLQHEGWTAPTQRLGLRPEPHRVRGFQAPADIARTRPRILVGFGTFFGTPEVLKPILGGLARLDADIVVPLSSGGSAGDFGDLASRVTFVPFTPLDELLAGIDLLVTHGGNGTAFGALARGIPLVTIPQGADQFILAERLAAAGAGRTLQPDAITPPAVAELAGDALADPGLRAAAERLAGEIAALPSPDAVAAELAAALEVPEVSGV